MTGREEGPLRAARRLWHTCRYFRPGQLTGRLAAGVRRRLGLVRLPDAPAGLAGRLPTRIPLLDHDPWNDTEGVARGRLTFLRRTRELGRPYDWHPADASALWRFNLHYFDYLHLLAPGERVALCREWTDANPVGDLPGWHPYPTSVRIGNWCAALGGVEAGDVQASLYRQAAWLARNLESYLPGNHLLENARALVLAGRYFGDAGEAPAWRERGLRLLRDELSRQVLPDGGHVERSPMYHALVLEGCLDVLNVLDERPGVRSELEATARRMAAFLADLTHPDGCIALFNDAAVEIAPSVPRLLRYAADLTEGGGPAGPEQGVSSRAQSGYHLVRGGPFYLAVDGGPVGPDELPAHAHADLLSYELSVRERRFVVDTGVFGYDAGPVRDLVRSTRAHNTVSVDGQDQVECWGAFRVARRFAPRHVAMEPVGEGFRFEGTFDGYGRLLGDGIRHRRVIEGEVGLGRLRVVDRVEGSGRHEVASHLHLHPEVRVEERGEHLRLRREGVSLTLRANPWPRTGSGWYCPRFGLRRESPVLRMTRTGRLPAEIRYTLELEH